MFINLTADGSLQFEPQGPQEKAMLEAWYEQTGDDESSDPNGGESVCFQAGKHHAKIVVIR